MPSRLTDIPIEQERVPIPAVPRVRHYPATAIASSAGRNGTRWGADATTPAEASREAGMRVSFRVLPNPAHSRSTGAAGLERLAAWWRLP